MKTLDRYIGTKVARGYLLVMAILLPILTLFVFMRELDEIGKGDYHLVDVCVFAILTIPRRMVEVAPVTALLGSIIGLGQLAKAGELVAMQAAGISPLRIAGSVLGIGALLMGGVVAVQQYAAPPADQLALTLRSQALADTGDLRTQRGFWSREARQFVNVREVLHGQIPTSIDLYQFDEEGRLTVFSHAVSANTDNPRYWLLTDVVQKEIGERDLTERRLRTLFWESFLTPQQIGLLVYPVETLSLSDLYQYVRYLRSTGQSAEGYELSLWHKLSMPIATGAMVLVGIPFMFGPLRASTAGKRILTGAVIAVAFYIVSRIVAHSAVVFNLSPELSAMGPVFIILGLAVFMFHRLR